MLEIRLPKEVNKTPLAMEIILTALHQAGKGDYLKTFIQGNVRPWFTFELVSIDGQVHFYVWTFPKFRRLIESQFYAQYPGVEIIEVEDYAVKVPLNPETRPLWGMAFKLTKDDAYPIKTYVDYGQDKTEKEEFKTDPMTSVLEFLGSVKRGDQVWIQILFQAHRSETLKDDARFSTFRRKDWKDDAKEEIKAKIEELKSDDAFRPPTEGEKEVIAALQRSQSKFAFEVGIRGMYISQAGAFDPLNITGLIGSFRQYSSNTLNGFRLAKATTFDYPWQDFLGTRKAKNEKKILNAYKLRSFFQVPYRHLMTKPFILTTEEIATIFHLPGQVASTPTLVKAQSRKGEAPANLPI